MPVRLFRMMESMVDRIKAHEELDDFNTQVVALAEGGEESVKLKETYVDGLVKRTGPVMKIENDADSPIAAEPLDREGLLALKNML